MGSLLMYLEYLDKYDIIYMYVYVQNLYELDFSSAHDHTDTCTSLISSPNIYISGSPCV